MRRKIALEPGHPEKLHIQLSHFKQKYNWDCGLSCTLMVLSEKKRQLFLKNFTKICEKEGFNKSTWTIDLCYLLKKFDVPHIFYTTTLGVHEGYRGNSFYHHVLNKKFDVPHIFYTTTLGVHEGYRGNSFYHHVLNKDEQRINDRFQKAEALGIFVRKLSVSITEIIAHLVKGPGHYIVICGYDINSRKVFYRNPTFGDHVCTMSMELLDLARRSYGTDEDIIFIFK
ncbi:hypothetical protein JTB14_017970 [Gonioctena quinquepunctata]|nr:hypothetical protein JTB14_017970 [Gonioctena quinquepunctata]KAG5878103.1 hypothetical protein JTB14_017970 [Gonioctena quinquepunctata]